MPGTAPSDFQAERQRRKDARRRDRGGIFQPLEKNALMDVLLSRRKSGRFSPKATSPSSRRKTKLGTQPRKRGIRGSKAVEEANSPAAATKKVARSRKKVVSASNLANKPKSAKGVSRRPRTKTEEKEIATTITRKASSRGTRKRAAVERITEEAEVEEQDTNLGYQLQSRAPPVEEIASQEDVALRGPSGSRRKRKAMDSETLAKDPIIPAKKQRTLKKAASPRRNDSASATVSADAPGRGRRSGKPISYAEDSEDETVLTKTTANLKPPEMSRDLHSVHHVAAACTSSSARPVDRESKAGANRGNVLAQSEDHAAPKKPRTTVASKGKRNQSSDLRRHNNIPVSPVHPITVPGATASDDVAPKSRPKSAKRKAELDEETRPVSVKKRKLKAIAPTARKGEIEQISSSTQQQVVQSSYREELVPLNDSTNTQLPGSPTIVTSKGTRLTNVPKRIRDLVVHGSRRWTIFAPSPGSDGDDPLDLL